MKDGARLVLITAPIETYLIDRLRHLSQDVRIQQWSHSTEGDIPSTIWQKVEVLFSSFATRLPAPEDAPGLHWVQLYSAGPDSVLAQPLFAAPVTFTTTSGIHAVTMAEYVFTVLLAWFHRLPHMLNWQQQGRWPTTADRRTSFTGEELRGKTMAIVGYGSIGRQVALLAKAFGMRVLAMQRGSDHHDRGFHLSGVGDPEGKLPDRYFATGQLNAMLAESDIVVVAVPLTKLTYGMFDEKAFHAMKTTAFLVNVSRGDICDEAALVRALESKQIAGAALDVFHHEPLPDGHPLWSLDNVIISPHISGLTQQYNASAVAVFEENLRRYLAGESLVNVVDKQSGY